MALFGRLLPVLAAVILAACSASSSMRDFTSDKTAIAPADPAGRTAGNLDAKKEASARPAGSESSAAQKVALSLTAVADPNSKAYKIGPRDMIEITVFKVPDLSKIVQVSETGAFSYPLVGEVQAAGKTAREIEQELTQALGAKYLQNPQINVMVKEFNSQRVTVEGAVKKPGVVPIQGGLTMLQAVALSGGFEETAEENVLLLRQIEGKRSIAKYSVSDIRSNRTADPQLEAGDVLVAPTSDVKQGLFYVMKVLPLATLVPLL
jgi:polysaccharide biosynthesis/export protein